MLPYWTSSPGNWRTSCLTQIRSLLKPRWKYRASLLSGTVPDRRYGARESLSRCNTQPCSMDESTISTSHHPKQHSPDVFENVGACGDVIALVDVILRNYLRDSERKGTSPPQQFLQQCGDVRQVVPIRKFWQAVVAYNPVKFLMCLLHHVRIKSHHKEEAFQGRQGLNSGEVGVRRN